MAPYFGRMMRYSEQARVGRYGNPKTARGWSWETAST